MPVSILPVEGTFTSATASGEFTTKGGFNISLSGFGSATVQLQRSFDRGVTWKVVEAYTADIEKRVDDPEVGVYYRFNVSSYTSGDIVYRLSA